jgi:hypothetical protein
MYLEVWDMSKAASDLETKEVYCIYFVANAADLPSLIVPRRNQGPAALSVGLRLVDVRRALKCTQSVLGVQGCCYYYHKSLVSQREFRRILIMRAGTQDLYSSGTSCIRIPEFHQIYASGTGVRPHVS